MKKDKKDVKAKKDSKKEKLTKKDKKNKELHEKQDNVDCQIDDQDKTVQEYTAVEKDVLDNISKKKAKKE